MSRSARFFQVGPLLMAGILTLVGWPGVSGAGQAAGKPPVLKPLSVTLPDGGDQTFPDLGIGKPGAEAINNNCLACHSADMVMNQPSVAKEVWPGIVHKMIDTYKAPVAPEDVDAIIAYLQTLKGR